jgi:hypothetical protein
MLMKPHVDPDTAGSGLSAHIHTKPVHEWASNCTFDQQTPERQAHLEAAATEWLERNASNQDEGFASRLADARARRAINLKSHTAVDRREEIEAGRIAADRYRNLSRQFGE